LDSGSPAKSSAVNIQFIPLWPLCKILSAVCSTLLHIMGISRSFPILKLRRLRFLIALGVFEVAAVFFLTSGLAQRQSPPLLVIVTEDGMRPDYITEADSGGAKVPNVVKQAAPRIVSLASAV
jgi:hypothetical protein